MKTDLFQSCGHCFWCVADRAGSSKKGLGHALWRFLVSWSHAWEPLFHEGKAGCPGPSFKHIAEVGLLNLRVSFTSLNVWKFTVHELLKPGLENFKHYFTSMWDKCNCAVVWALNICEQIWKTQQWPQDWKRSVFFQSQRKAKPKNVQTTAQLHSSHTLVK